MDKTYAEQAQQFVANQTWMRADAQTQAYMAGQIATLLGRAHQNGRNEMAAELESAK